jgi:hypothetical protein
VSLGPLLNTHQLSRAARTRSIARICRTQRDAAGGKLEVGEVGAHDQVVIAGLDPAIHPLR